MPNSPIQYFKKHITQAQMDTLITQQKVLGPLSDEHTPFSNCCSLCSLKLKPASCIWSAEGFFLVSLLRCVWGKHSSLHSLFKKETVMVPSNKTKQCFLTYKQLRNSLGKHIAFWFLEQSRWWYLLCPINTSSTLQRETWNNRLNKAFFKVLQLALV